MILRVDRMVDRGLCMWGMKYMYGREIEVGRGVLRALDTGGYGKSPHPLRRYATAVILEV